MQGSAGRLGTSVPGDEDFLARWSRRKATARRGEGDDAAGYESGGGPAHRRSPTPRPRRRGAGSQIRARQPGRRGRSRAAGRRGGRRAGTATFRTSPPRRLVGLPAFMRGPACQRAAPRRPAQVLADQPDHQQPGRTWTTTTSPRTSPTARHRGRRTCGRPTGSAKGMLDAIESWRRAGARTTGGQPRPAEPPASTGRAAEPAPRRGPDRIEPGLTVHVATIRSVAPAGAACLRFGAVLTFLAIEDQGEGVRRRRRQASSGHGDQNMAPAMTGIAAQSGRGRCARATFTACSRGSWRRHRTAGARGGSRFERRKASWGEALAAWRGRAGHDDGRGARRVRRPVHRPRPRRAGPVRLLLPHRLPATSAAGGSARRPRALGIARRPAVPEPEDHIARLCETMAGLIGGELRRPPTWRTQQAFFDRHLAPWAPRFFADLERARAARLYAPVGRLGRLFMEIEAPPSRWRPDAGRGPRWREGRMAATRSDPGAKKRAGARPSAAS